MQNNKPEQRKAPFATDATTRTEADLSRLLQSSSYMAQADLARLQWDVWQHARNVRLACVKKGGG